MTRFRRIDDKHDWSDRIPQTATMDVMLECGRCRQPSAVMSGVSDGEATRRLGVLGWLNAEIASVAHQRGKEKFYENHICPRCAHDMFPGRPL